MQLSNDLITGAVGPLWTLVLLIAAASACPVAADRTRGQTPSTSSAAPSPPGKSAQGTAEKEVASDVGGRRFVQLVVVGGGDPITRIHVQHQLKRLGIRTEAIWLSVDWMAYDVPAEEAPIARRVLESDRAYADYMMLLPPHTELSAMARCRPWHRVVLNASVGSLLRRTQPPYPCVLQNVLRAALRERRITRSSRIHGIVYVERPYVDETLNWVVGYNAVVWLEPTRRLRGVNDAPASLAYDVYGNGSPSYNGSRLLWSGTLTTP